MPINNFKVCVLVLGICLIICGTGLSRAPQSSSQASTVPNRWALLVAISDYQNGTNPADQWGSLKTKRDLEHMQVALENYGFKEPGLRSLTDEEATQDNVISVFREHLIKNAKPGDRVVFYYTGHGFHVPDTNGDETADREDEATVMWVPKDKQNLPREQRQAVMYMLDDTYQSLLKDLAQNMRDKDGKVQGSITVIFDSCSAGSGIKAALVPKGRDWDDKVDGPRRRDFVPSDVASGWLTLGKDQLEDVAFIAGSQSNEFSYMMPNYERDGSVLTYHLSQFLINIAKNKPDRKISYDDIHQSLIPKVEALGRPQNPQVEGNIFAEIFGDGVPLSKPTLPAVRRVRENPLTLEIPEGSLHGIGVGSRYDLYQKSTAVENPANKLGELLITSIRSTSSEGTIANPRSTSIQPSDYEAAQAVLTQQSFHGGPINVLIPATLGPRAPQIPASKLKVLNDAVTGADFISQQGVTEDNFDLKLGWCADQTAQICKGIAGKFFYQRANGKVLPLDSNIDSGSLKHRLLAEWRRRRLAELSLPGFAKIRVEMVDKNNRPFRTENGRAILKPGNEGKIRVVNNTGVSMFITLIYLRDSGDITVFPRGKQVLGQQPIKRTPGPYHLFSFDKIQASQTEVEMLRVIATPRPADFSRVGYSAEERKGMRSKGPKNPLEELLFGIKDGTPTDITMKQAELDRWYTDVLVYEIRPN